MDSTTKPLTINEANRVACRISGHQVRISRCKIDHRLWSIDINGRIEAHEPMTDERLRVYLREWCPRRWGMMTVNIEFEVQEFETAGEAIQWAEASGKGEAVLVRGRNMVVDKNTLDVLHARGFEFAYLQDHEMPDGTHTIVTMPVND